MILTQKKKKKIQQNQNQNQSQNHSCTSQLNRNWTKSEQTYNK